MAADDALRDEIARALFVEGVGPEAAPAWDAPGDGGRQRWWNYADAVLPILAAEKAKWQAEALRDAADEVGAMYFGPDQGVPFTRGSAHKWGSDAAATRLRDRAEHIEKGEQA